MKRVGHCKLTSSTGPFVRSHIIPRAFTDKILTKNMRVEWGDFSRPPQLRHSSWFDERIVTAEGEAILADYDNYAARALIESGLVWRSFPPKSNVERSEAFGDDGIELIKVSGIDSKKLRLFFLSLLWRSCVSSLRGFSDIKLPVTQLEKLRRIVAGEVNGDLSDFPVVLLLMTTKGEPQNHTPLKDIIDMSEIDSSMENLPIFRFWLDGLIAHFGRRPRDTKCYKVWENRVVGSQDEITLIGRKYEGSRQDMMIEHFKEKMEEIWPKQSAAIYGAIHG